MGFLEPSTLCALLLQVIQQFVVAINTISTVTIAPAVGMDTVLKFLNCRIIAGRFGIVPASRIIVIECVNEIVGRVTHADSCPNRQPARSLHFHRLTFFPFAGICVFPSPHFAALCLCKIPRLSGAVVSKIGSLTQTFLIGAYTLRRTFSARLCLQHAVHFHWGHLSGYRRHGLHFSRQSTPALAGQSFRQPSNAFLSPAHTCVRTRIPLWAVKRLPCARSACRASSIGATAPF